ncbi:hypothetical protein LR48_Vigan11g045100 [Vigna angularis]|uniref:Putative plant transposon protein domain-containing protein n=1 Tax=Phaseolus angularis TaxID=3914 RepID=A0A0L9VR35_PHAAN|nr:hypothetical protein LR48_Vigan11g045100 [Vigna angularis]
MRLHVDVQAVTLARREGLLNVKEPTLCYCFCFGPWQLLCAPPFPSPKSVAAACSLAHVGRTTSSSGKRVKIVGHKRKEKETIYANKFLTAAHEKYFLIMDGRRLLMERGEEETYMSYVRGKKIFFDADTVNNFLGTDWNGEHCQFALSMEEGVDFDEVEWMAFTHANIQPYSHVSDITPHMAIFLFSVVRGLNINIEHVIVDEIHNCACSANNKSPLGHPSLITHLCEIAGVNVSTPPLERPRKEIDASDYT